MMPMATKIKFFNNATEGEIFPDKVSLNELRKIWNDGKRQYTDAELEQIKCWLYVMAEVIVKVVGRRNTLDVADNCIDPY